MRRLAPQCGPQAREEAGRPAFSRRIVVARPTIRDRLALRGRRDLLAGALARRWSRVGGRRRSFGSVAAAASSAAAPSTPLARCPVRRSRGVALGGIVVGAWTRRVRAFRTVGASRGARLAAFGVGLRPAGSASAAAAARAASFAASLALIAAGFVTRGVMIERALRDVLVGCTGLGLQWLDAGGGLERLRLRRLAAAVVAPAVVAPVVVAPVVVAPVAVTVPTAPGRRPPTAASPVPASAAARPAAAAVAALAASRPCGHGNL